MKSLPSSTTLDDLNAGQPRRQSIEQLLLRLRSAASWAEAVELRNQALLAAYELVPTIVRRFSRSTHHDDLLGVGTCALLQAVGQFDPNRGVPFRAYAAKIIRFHLLDYLASQGESGLLFEAETARHLRRLRRTIAESDNAPNVLSDVELARATRLPASRVASLRWFVQPCASLSSPLDDDRQVAEQTPLPSEAIANVDDARELTSALHTLDWRTRFVLEGAFGLDGKGARTHSEIAALLGLTRQRVQQIAADGLVLLRRAWRP